MAPILHCVRHAQGYHNLGVEYHGIQDPKLTPLGEEQCTTLKTIKFPDQSKLSLITASPLSRTLHTAYVAFGPALKEGHAAPKILAIPDAQETSDYLCDTGSDIPVLEKTCQEHNWPVDLHLLDDKWNVKTLDNRYSPASNAIKIRARDTRKLIRQKMRELVASGIENPEVVLVAHGAYLHYFTDDWEDSNKLLGTGWTNCETRAYTFDQGVGSDDENAYLTETMESRQDRGLDYPMRSRSEQKQLFLQSMQQWEDQGLQNASKIGVGSDEIQVEIPSQGEEPASTLVKVDSNSIKASA